MVYYINDIKTLLNSFNKNQLIKKLYLDKYSFLDTTKTNECLIKNQDILKEVGKKHNILMGNVKKILNINSISKLNCLDSDFERISDINFNIYKRVMPETISKCQSIFTSKYTTFEFEKSALLSVFSCCYYYLVIMSIINQSKIYDYKNSKKFFENYIFLSCIMQSCLSFFMLGNYYCYALLDFFYSLSNDFLYNAKNNKYTNPLELIVCYMDFDTYKNILDSYIFFERHIEIFTLTNMLDIFKFFEPEHYHNTLKKVDYENFSFYTIKSTYNNEPYDIKFILEHLAYREQLKSL